MPHMPWFMASVYDRFMAGMERASGDAWRAELLGDVAGDVLELGMGTGTNLPHYSSEVRRLTAVEPDVHMRRKLEARLDRAPPRFPVDVVTWDAARIEADDASYDVVVATLLLCSVVDVEGVLQEIRRVLRPRGRFVFLEHVASPDPSRRAWQRRIEPVWKRLAGNCHLCRETESAIAAAGFTFERVTTESARKALPIVRSVVRGVASVASVASVPETAR